MMNPTMMQGDSLQRHTDQQEIIRQAMADSLRRRLEVAYDMFPEMQGQPTPMAGAMPSGNLALSAGGAAAAQGIAPNLGWNAQGQQVNP